MPVVTVDWLAGRSAQQKQALAESLTKAFVEIAKVSPDQVWIVFRDVPRADWAMGGKLLDPG
jgi:4-oxalocrotonate tautomerase